MSTGSFAVGDRVRNARGTFGRVVTVLTQGRIRVLWDGMAPDAWVVYHESELTLIERPGGAS